MTALCVISLFMTTFNLTLSSLDLNGMLNVIRHDDVASSTVPSGIRIVGVKGWSARARGLLEK